MSWILVELISQQTGYDQTPLVSPCVDIFIFICQLWCIARTFPGNFRWHLVVKQASSWSHSVRWLGLYVGNWTYSHSQTEWRWNCLRIKILKYWTYIVYILVRYYVSRDSTGSALCKMMPCRILDKIWPWPYGLPFEDCIKYIAINHLAMFWGLWETMLLKCQGEKCHWTDPWICLYVYVKAFPAEWNHECPSGHFVWLLGKATSWSCWLFRL